jgi:hypothetical protein
MSNFDQEIVEFFQHRLIRQAQAARQVKQFETTRLDIHHRLLGRAGDTLISLGLKMKNLSRPAGDQEYTPLYT